MPRLAPGHRVSPETRTAFAEAYDKLLEHEHGHMVNAVNAAKDIENALWDMGWFVSCDRLGEKANETARAIVRKYKKRNLDYDGRTDHGRRVD